MSAESRILGRWMPHASNLGDGRCRGRRNPNARRKVIIKFTASFAFAATGLEGEREAAANGLYFAVCLPFVVAVLLLFLLSPFQTVRWSPTTAKEISDFVGRVLVPPSLHKTFRSARSTIICVQIARARSDENNSPLTTKGRKGVGGKSREHGRAQVASFSPDYHFSLSDFSRYASLLAQHNSRAR